MYRYFKEKETDNNIFEGDLIYVKIFKDRTLFINSYDLAVELLDRRASIYSSRPRFVMSNELCVLHYSLLIDYWVSCL